MQEDNLKEPLFVLLGASASVDYGIPSTKTLTEYLLKCEYYSDPPDPKSKWMPFSTIKDLLSGKIKDLDGNAIPDDKINFEELVEIAESGLLNNHEEIIYGLEPLIKPLIRLSTEAEEVLKLDASFTVYASLAKLSILDLINNKCTGIGNNTKNIPLVSGLEQFSDSFTLKGFSLNYDDLPFRTKINFQTGFEKPTDNLGYGLFNSSKVLDETNEDTMYQLHGSVYFGDVPDEGSTNGSLVRYQDGNDASKHRTAYPSKIAQNQKIRSNVYCIMGLSKTDQLLVEPYSSYFHQFRTEAFRCKRWLIVGYGGMDQHINSVLGTARKFHHKKNENDFRCLIVNYAKKVIEANALQKLFLCSPFLENDVDKRETLNKITNGGNIFIGSKIAVSFNGTEKSFQQSTLKNIIEFLRN